MHGEGETMGDPSSGSVEDEEGAALPSGGGEACREREREGERESESWDLAVRDVRRFQAHGCRAVSGA